MSMCTVWCMLDRKTNRPTRVTQAMKQTFENKDMII